ncbi:shikimate kinase [Hippea maritima]|nr:shikimate kinase [Hippea maritima]
MNVSLIGMPSSGKSSIGVILAKMMRFNFIDTDIIIQNNTKRTLQQIVDSKGYLKLRQIEEETILSLNPEHSIISTGGSVVYSKKAMEYLKNVSLVVYIKVSFEEIKKRLGDYSLRGLAKPKDQTIAEMYKERTALYERYADIIFENHFKNATIAAEKLKELIDENI